MDGACARAAGGGGSWWCLLSGTRCPSAPLASYGLVAHFPSCSPVVVVVVVVAHVFEQRLTRLAYVLVRVCLRVRCLSVCRLDPRRRRPACAPASQRCCRLQTATDALTRRQDHARRALVGNGRCSEWLLLPRHERQHDAARTRVCQPLSAAPWPRPHQPRPAERRAFCSQLALADG